MRKLEPCKPAHVRFGPSPLASMAQLVPQQKRRDLLALRAQIYNRRLARPNEFPHRLMAFVRNPHRGEFPGAQQLHQAHRIAPVGLHPIARPLGNERRRNHQAVLPKALDLPVQPIACRPGLVTERQAGVLAGKLTYQLGGCRCTVLNLPNKANLTRPSGLRNRHRIPPLGCIKCYKSFAIMPHDLPSLLEALPGPSGQSERVDRADLARLRVRAGPGRGRRGVRRVAVCRHAPAGARNGVTVPVTRFLPLPRPGEARPFPGHGRVPPWRRRKSAWRNRCVVAHG